MSPLCTRARVVSIAFAAATVAVAAGASEPEGSPGIVVHAVVVDDSLGNGSGSVDFAECVQLSITLRNDGPTPVSGLSATLIPLARALTLISDSSSYPVLSAGGGTGANLTPFKLVTLANPASAGRPLGFILRLSTGHELPVSLPVAAVTSQSAPATGPVAIPDNAPAGATLSIPVAGFTNTLARVRARVHATHPRTGDLVLRLKAPDGLEVELAKNVGGAGVNFGTDCPASANDTTFDDEALTPIGLGSAPFLGSYRPSGSLASFTGRPASLVNGTWALRVEDQLAGNVGSIQCVTLELNGGLYGGGACQLKGDLVSTPVGPAAPDLGTTPPRQTDLIFANADDSQVPPVYAGTNIALAMNGILGVSSTPICPDATTDWEVSGADDFDRDGDTDLVLRHTTTGAAQIWLMNGATRAGMPVPVSPALPPGWRVVATGDVNHDGVGDLLLRDGLSQALEVWRMQPPPNVGQRLGTALVPDPPAAVNSNWRVVGLLDLDLDGNKDLLWYNDTTGKVVYWLLDSNLVRFVGNFTSPAGVANGDPNWSVLAAGDYGGGAACDPAARDSQIDIVWQHKTSHNIVVWVMDRNARRVAGCFTCRCPTPAPGVTCPCNAPDPGAACPSVAAAETPHVPRWFIVGPR